MSSLKARIELLESDLKAVPSRISVYHDLPFAILRYDPREEWELRREVKRLATRLESTGKEVHLLPMSEFLWRAIDESEGVDEIVALERQRGYLAAQEQVTTYLSDRDWRPLAQLLAERLAGWSHSQGNRDAAISVSKVVERTFELWGRRRQGKALVLIIDEVGQHVARSGDKIEDLGGVRTSLPSAVFPTFFDGEPLRFFGKTALGNDTRTPPRPASQDHCPLLDCSHYRMRSTGPLSRPSSTSPLTRSARHDGRPHSQAAADPP